MKGLKDILNFRHNNNHWRWIGVGDKTKCRQTPRHVCRRERERKRERKREREKGEIEEGGKIEELRKKKWDKRKGKGGEKEKMERTGKIKQKDKMKTKRDGNIDNECDIRVNTHAQVYLGEKVLLRQCASASSLGFYDISSIRAKTTLHVYRAALEVPELL